MPQQSAVPPEGHLGGDRHPGGPEAAEDQRGQEPHQGGTRDPLRFRQVGGRGGGGGGYMSETNNI